MEKTVYVAPDGAEFDELPAEYGGVTPVTFANYRRLGWTTRREEVPQPQPPPPSDELAGKERAFVAKVAEYAAAYGAMEELAEMEAPSIQALLALAAEKGAAADALAGMESALLTLARDFEHATGGVWTDAWDGLVSRFAGYLGELAAGAAE
jgi:hypothetical protein